MQLSLSNLCLLLVDDERNQLELTSVGLQEFFENLVIVEASSASQAFDEIRKRHFDCIVADYKMPDMDGLELCKTLRKSKNETPFILFTGHGSELVAERAFKVGVDGYLRKERGLSVYAVLAQKIRANVRRRRSEEALRVSEERFSKAFQSSPAIKAITRLSDGLFVDVNESFLNAFGYSREEVIGNTSKKLRMFWGEEGREKLVSLLKENGRIVNLERNFRTKDGKKFIGQTSIETMQIGDQEYAVSTLIDITNRKKAEAERLLSEKQARIRADELETVLDVIPSAVWISRDPDCLVITGNRVANEFYEAGSGENVSAGPTSGVWQDATRRFFKNGVELKPEELPMQEAAAKGVDVMDYEMEVLLPSGRSIVILGNASPLFDEERRVRGSVAAFLNITDRKQMQLRLEEYSTQLEEMIRERSFELEKREEMLRDFIDSSSDALIIFDDEFRIIRVNKSVESFLPNDVNLESVNGLHITDVFRSLPNSERYKGYLNVLKTGEPYYTGPYHVERFSPPRWFETTAFRVGSGIGLVIREVTERIKMEEHIHRSEKLDSVSRIGATVAHDLRGPLSLVTQSLDLATKQPEKYQKMLTIARENAERAINMIEEFRVGTRDISLVKQSVTLNSVIEEAVCDTKIPENIRLEMKLSEEPIPINIDPAMIRRVIDNLVTNSIEAMPEGGLLTISTMVLDKEAWVEVQDTGVGMNYEVASKIGEPLYTTKATGMGLGLYFVNRAVEAHEGSIRFRTDLGNGTTFTIKLPI